ncbi:MAG: hypothetical protein IKC69_06680 [Clostridia bacterium]|nr:hypothetical protein [Clostridia bacterium]
MKKASNIIWGIVLIAAGVIWGLNELGVASINFFFDGWWTLFIILPCGIGLFTERKKTGNIIGLFIGIMLLLACQEIISFSVLWKLFVPAIIVIIGLRLVLGGLFDNRADEVIKQMKSEGKEPRVGFAAFSGCDLNFDGESFEGAELNAIFGGVKCDLRNAIIEKDCAVRVSAIFGGIDILVPEGITVKANTVNLFGGTSNKTSPHQNAPTIYVNGTCMFGGVEIK